MDLIEHISSRNSFVVKMETVLERIHALVDVIKKELAPSPGPYLFFHHQASTHQRATELSLIIRRLYDNRVDLLKNDVVKELACPKDWPGGVPYPSEYQEIAKLGHNIDAQIVLDFQTMLLFAGIALDDWAHVAGYVLGVPNPIRSSFEKVAKDDGSGPFAELWVIHKEAILWLDAFTRLYRNKMIVHRERPWQIGHTSEVYGLDWQLWTPIAPGWVSAKRREEVKQDLDEMARSIGLEPLDDIHNLIHQLLHNCATFDREDRKKVYKAAEELGFGTPTFQEFAHRLADFLDAATTTLTELASANPKRINLGDPPN